MSEIDREQRSWRSQVLQGLLWATTALFTIVGGTVIRDGLYGNQGNWVFVACGVLSLAASLSRRRLPYTVRALTLLGLLAGASVYVLARGGYAPNAFIAFAFVSTAGTLLLGARGGIAIVALFAAALVVVPALHQRGVLVRSEGWQRRLDSGSGENLARVAINFTVLSLSSVLAVAYLLRRSERLLREKAISLERLALEQSERERIQNDLVRREAAFRKAGELEILGRLSGSMAHDFNNALVVIFGVVDDLARAGLAPAQHAVVEELRAAATQAASATRQLRAFGPDVAGAAAELALGPAVRRVGALLARVLPSNIELSLDVDDELHVLADEGEIQRMFTNLVLNARDAMREGGSIVVSVRRCQEGDRAFVAIEVEDDGAGMSEEVRQRLFEPFFTTKGGAGTGLGLSSVRELVERAGGHVRATSQLGTGTTLSVYWPLTEGPTRPASDERAAIDGTGTTVLLADDDGQVRSVLARGLRQRGFSVLEAADGREALLAARRHREPIHILCTDCIMPGIPLRELITGFRHVYPEARVIVCSGYAPDAAGLDPGAADQFLGKPFHVRDLAEKLGSLRAESVTAARTTTRASRPRSP